MGKQLWLQLPLHYIELVAKVLWEKIHHTACCTDISYYGGREGSPAPALKSRSGNENAEAGMQDPPQ